MGSAILGLCVLLAGEDPRGRAAHDSPSAQLQLLHERYESALRDMKEASDQAENAKDPGQKAEWSRREQAIRCERLPALWGEFVAFAKAHPGTKAAEDALVWVGSHVLYDPATEEARRLLARDYIESKQLGLVLAFQWNTPGSLAAEHLLREAVKKSPHHEIRGLAHYWLGRYLTNQASWVRAARKGDLDEKVRERSPSTLSWGLDYVDRLRKRDADALEQEAADLFERAAREYPDVEVNDKRRPGLMKDVAARYVHELRGLAVGEPAPEIEGGLLDGTPFRLSTYRGKVVVLIFGSHFL